MEADGKRGLEAIDTGPECRTCLEGVLPAERDDNRF